LNSDPALDVDSDLGDAAYSAAILEQRAKNKEADLEAARNLVESIEGKRRKKGRNLWAHSVDGCMSVEYIKIKASPVELSDEHSALKYRLTYLYNASRDRRRKAEAKVGVVKARKLHEAAHKLQQEFQACLKEYNSKYSR